MQFLRDVLDFFGVKFKISPAEREGELGLPTGTGEGREGTGEVTVSCVGVGYSNVNRAMA